MDFLRGYGFLLPTRIVSGPGVSARVGEEVKALGARHAMLLTDPGVLGAGIIEPLKKALTDQGVKVSVFSEIEPNPRDVTVEEAARRGASVDTLVAVGGGSVIDAAKAVGVLLSHGGRIAEYRGMGKLKRPITPLIAIPTTAGTGSEVTFWSVITVTRNTEWPFKIGVGGPEVAPILALLDPQLTISLPPLLTASTGMDALTHALEAYTTIPANPLTSALALSAIDIIGSNLKVAVKDGKCMKARAAMLQASLLAGIAFGMSDLGAVHSISEAVGGLHDTPHGVTNAVVLPHVIRYNESVRGQEFLEIARALGISVSEPSEAGEAVASYVRSLNEEMGIPGGLRELGVEEIDLPELARRAMLNSATGCNPRKLTAEDFTNLLKVAME